MSDRKQSHIFYSKKRVLITGGSGFIGANLINKLQESGAEVAVITRSKVHNLDVTVFTGSIEEKKFVTRTLEQFSPQIIFHLAAARTRSLTFEAFTETIQANLMGSLNLFYASLMLKNLERIVVLGTAEEYGNNAAPFKEIMREAPVSAYSFSKQSVTHLAQLMHESFKLPAAVLRPSIAYGPGQNKDMFLPAFLDSLIKNQPFPMTLGEQTRDFVFIDDLIEAILRAGYYSGLEGEIINIGSGQPIRIADLVKKVERLLQVDGLAKLGAIQYRKTEQMNYWLDVSKAKSLLNWEVSTMLEEGLKKTINSYRMNGAE